MIAWSIEAALRSGSFDRIIVSTDDGDISDVARAYGAEVPFLRPVQLADDFASTSSVVAHAVQWYSDLCQEFSAVCCLYATAPLVSPLDIQQGLELLVDTPVDRFVFAACDYASPIERALRLDEVSREVHMLQPEQFGKRSQDLEPAYHDAGQFYWGRPQAWLSCDNLFDRSRALILPRWRVQDIDTSEDWIHAELKWRILTQQTLTGTNE